jgi:hypothetical protein
LISEGEEHGITLRPLRLGGALLGFFTACRNANGPFVLTPFTDPMSLWYILDLIGQGHETASAEFPSM